MLKVTDIAFTGYSVTDLTAARHFYEDILGLTVTMCMEDEGKAWIEYVLPSGTLSITNMVPAWKASTSGPSIALEVEDMQSALATLKEKGVSIMLENFDSPVCTTSVILDPDKNAIMLHEKKSCHPDLTGEKMSCCSDADKK